MCLRTVSRTLLSDRATDEDGLTSDKSFSAFGQVFGCEVLATAPLDRLLHHRDVVPINGPVTASPPHRG